MPIAHHAVLIVTVFSPYLMLAGPLALAFASLARRTPLVFASLALTVVTVAIQCLPDLGSDSSRSERVAFRLMSANLREGDADATNLLKTAGENADVLAVQELTPVEAERLAAAGVDAIFPYRLLDARKDADGVGLWSRFPLGVTTRLGGYTFPFLVAELQMAGISPNPTVAVVHLVAPWPQRIEGWRREIAKLPLTLRDIAKTSPTGCVIVAGDFNSTTDMRPFRDLEQAGYRIARQSRPGSLRTFPGDSPLPPLIGIDHVLARNCTATSLRTVEVRGSDHRGVLATVTNSPY